MDDPIREMQESLARTTTLGLIPFDAALQKEAEDARGHLGSQAVFEEFSRLLVQKYFRPPSRGFWSRLFGS